MKFLLFLAILLLAVWLWRSGRRSDSRSDQAAAPPPPGPQAMVRCAHCGVHLPHGEAIVGRIGLYCSSEHRQNAEP
ncbi:MAG: hypothetical protein KGL73_08715 [Burkholderiales bacterium]|nr:hypothetical protein [Burkholderiales bacterium]